MSEAILYLDVETTGLSPRYDRIVQIAVGNEQMSACYLVDPEVTIPKEVIDIHGITNEQVSGKPRFKDIAAALSPFFDTAKYICGYNVSFDFKFIQFEFSRAGFFLNSSDYKFLDPLSIHKTLNKNDLASMYKRYTGKQMEGSHDAYRDMVACSEILSKQLACYSMDVDQLSQLGSYGHQTIGGWFSKRDDGVYLESGKYKGMRLLDLVVRDYDYVRWMESAKDIALEELLLLKEALR